MQLYVLKSISRYGNKCQDGSYEVFVKDLGIFDSVKKAEGFMRLIINLESEYSDFHCFVIFEKTLNGGLTKKWNTIQANIERSLARYTHVMTNPMGIPLTKKLTTYSGLTMSEA